MIHDNTFFQCHAVGILLSGEVLFFHQVTLNLMVTAWIVCGKS